MKHTKELLLIISDASDVLEHYDNDPMVQDILKRIRAAIPRQLLMAKVKKYRMENELTYSDELLIEGLGEK